MDISGKRTIDDLDVRGKRVLVRCDFNVPLLNGRITDDRRIRESLKTIRHLQENGAKVIACSHLGRPEEPSAELSLSSICKHIEQLLGSPVKMAVDSIGASVKKMSDDLQNGEIMLLENLRFHKEETQNDPGFAKELASLAELFVNDAFGAAHRAHSSTVGVCKFLPSAIGYLMLKELTILSNAINSPKRPLVSILGGAKVSDKIGVIDSLLDKVDVLILGGGMAYTFAGAQGFSVGRSICEKDKFEVALDIIKKAKQKGVTLLLPTDCIAAASFHNEADFKLVPLSQIPDEYMGMDIGSETVKVFSAAIKQAAGGTVIWNGPLGVCEFKNFEKGTKSLAKTLSETNLVSIIGGGDVAVPIGQLGIDEKLTHISTGGGASLRLLSGADMPGVAAVANKA
ncbi:MAG: phosphoglycerate kinase [Oscillospiraceae bacterium]|jgi:phosphoglycerate kinase|nr:phosphoglycerate kinase [Oscillospiraceae bacterium]